MASITIAGRQIGPGQPCWIVAELSGNAGQDFDKAVQMVYAAKEAGADAVKTQIFTPGSMTLRGDAEPFRLTWAGQQRTLWDLYSQTAMPLEWHPRLKTLTEALGMIYFASVFSTLDVATGQALDLPAFKVASFELVDLPLIRACAKTGKPIILSTGMATEEEIREAVKTGWGSRFEDNVAVLLCTSAYPAPVSDANLARLDRYESYPMGLSDHTLGIAVPVAAVALGASIIEKHLILSRADGGPDAAFSIEPTEFKQMVEAVRVAAAALGEVRYGPTESEREMLKLRRSLWVVSDIAKGEAFTAENVRSLRPADGLSPRHLDDVLGKRATRHCKRGEPLDSGMVE